MTITLDIRPEVEAELARQAAVQGRAIEAVAVALLEDAVHVPSAPRSQAAAKDMVELFAPVRGLFEDGEQTLAATHPRAAQLTSHERHERVSARHQHSLRDAATAPEHKRHGLGEAPGERDAICQRRHDG